MGFAVENTADDNNREHFALSLFCLIVWMFQTHRSDCVLDINTKWSGWTAYWVAIMPCTVTSPVCDPEARQYLILIVSKTNPACCFSFGTVMLPEHPSCLRCEQEKMIRQRLSLYPMWLECHITRRSCTQSSGSGEPSYMLFTLSLTEKLFTQKLCSHLDWLHIIKSNCSKSVTMELTI